jgi:hypothetical protein
MIFPVTKEAKRHMDRIDHKNGKRISYRKPESTLIRILKDNAYFFAGVIVGFILLGWVLHIIFTS